MEKQGPVKETARISENQKPVDEVSVEISGIARRRETKSVSFAVFGALGENEEERVKENDEVVRVNEKEEEKYRKDLQFLVEKEAEDEESDEEEEDTSQCSEQEEQVKEAKQAMEVEQEGQRWKNSLRGDVCFEKLVQIIQRFVLKNWFR